MRGDVNYTDQSFSQNTTAHTRGMGLAYGAQLGYLYQRENSHMFFLGEGYYIKDSTKSKPYELSFLSSTTKGAFTVQPTSSYGAALGIGMFFNPKFNLYGKVGLENKGIATTYTLPGQTQATPGVKKAAWGIAPAFGFMYNMTTSVAINPEYTYVMGKKYKVLGQNPDGTYTKGIRFTPTEHRLMLRLNYMFG